MGAGLMFIGANAGSALGGIVGFCIAMPIFLIAIWRDKRKSDK